MNIPLGVVRTRWRPPRGGLGRPDVTPVRISRYIVRLLVLVLIVALTLACSLAIEGHLADDPQPKTPCPQGNP